MNNESAKEWNSKEFTKIVVMGEDPEEIANQYADKDVIIIYPQGFRPSAWSLLHNNFVKIFSNYSKYPDIESLGIIKDMLMYLLNTSHLTSGDRVLVIFRKKGEVHRLFFDFPSMKIPTILNTLSHRVRREIVENVLKICRSIVKGGREGNPAGALFLVGDAENVKENVVQKIANPMSGIEPMLRDVKRDENLPTIREFALMDGAIIIDDRGYVVSAGAYVKNLEIQEWVLDGKGGRHLAAQSITRRTRTIGFVVSSEGVIRIYEDGKMIFELKDF